MRRIFSLVALLTTVACGGGDDNGGPAGPSPTNIAGTWHLQSVNGQPLPYIILQAGADKIEWVSDVVTVNSGGSFTQVTTLRYTENGQVTTETIPDAGYYELNGTNITFVFNSTGEVGNGTVIGNTITVATEGFSFIYRK